MFAALSGNDGSFFRKHMMRFVAIAPVVYLENIGAATIKEAASNETIVKGIKAIGPE